MPDNFIVDPDILIKRLEKYLDAARGWHLQKNYQEYQYWKGRFVECGTWFKDLGLADLHYKSIDMAKQFKMMDKMFET